MKKIQSIALMMAIALTGTVGFTACSSEEKIDENVVYDSNGNAGVKSEFVISVPRSVVRTTRMSDAETQSAGKVDQFRGIDNISLIPFSETPTGTSVNNADIIKLSSIEKGTMDLSIAKKAYFEPDFFDDGTQEKPEPETDENGEIVTGEDETAQTQDEENGEDEATEENSRSYYKTYVEDREQ